MVNLSIFENCADNALVVLFCVIGLMFVLKLKRRPHISTSNVKPFEKLPSPKGYPILGHFTKIGTLPHVTMTNWSKELGPLYRIKMGFQDVLVVSDIKYVRNGLMKHSTAFAGRPRIETFKRSNKQGGASLAFSDYSPAFLHEKGIAKAAISLYTTEKDPSKRSMLEISSFKHANCLVDQLLKEAEIEGKVNPREHIFSNVTNVICKICFGEEFELNDPKFLKLMELYKDFDKALGVTQVANFWPMLKYFPFVSKAFHSQQNYVGHISDIIKYYLKSHLETFDGHNHRDILDSLLHERKKQSLNVPNCFNTDDIQLKTVGSTFSIFSAGFDTVFTMLYWSMLYLAVFPDTQEKIREELDEIMPTDEQPSFRLHAGRCHYTVAWIYELMRHVSPLPVLLPHTTTQEVEFDNYLLPPGLSVYFNVHQIHFDPGLWENPKQFQPERFLDEDTQCFKQNRAANVLAWGMGKRFCPGKDLSKHGMFIFICTIVRRLKINPAIPGVEPVLDWPVEVGLSTKPKDFCVEIFEK